MNQFDFVKSITYTKKDIMANTDNDKLIEDFYTPFVVNRSLSYFIDTVLYSNEMNIRTADNRLQFLYLLNTVRPAKRFAKWVKSESVEDIDVIRQYYGYSTEKARQALNILTAEHLRYIKQKLQRGGVYDKNRESS